MAYLLKNKRKNPETGKVETYYLIGRWIEVQGRKVQKTAGLGFLTEKQAKAALAKYEAELEAGRDPLHGTIETGLESKPRSKTIPTLREWWGDIQEPWPSWPECRMRTYLDAQGIAPKTRRTYDDSRRTLVALLGDCRLDKITPAEGDLLVSRLRQVGFAARTIQIRVDALRRSLEVAQEDGIISSVPRLRRPKSETTESVFHTEEQTQKLLEVLHQRVAGTRARGRTYLAVLMAVSLGMRPGEVLTRRWEHLHLQDRTLKISPITLPDGQVWNPKAGSARKVPLTAPLAQLLREAWMEEGRPAEGWIFPNRDREGWPMTNFRKALAGACEAAELPVLHPHALRHSAATRWVERDVDIPTMMKLGGWKTPTVPLQIYAHTTSDRMREAMEDAEVGQFVNQTPLTSAQKGETPLAKSGVSSGSGQPDSNRRPSAPKTIIEIRKRRQT